MSLLALSPRDRRALAVGLTSIGLALVIGRGLPAWSRWQSSMGVSAIELRSQAARAQASVKRLGTTRDTLRIRKQRLQSMARRLVAGETSAMAGARLASIVTIAASAASVHLGSIQVRGDSAGRGTFRRIGLHADATGDVEGLAKLLNSLEGGPTLLAIRDLTVSQSEPAALPERAEALRIEFTIEGLMFTPQRISTPSAGRTAR